MITATDIAGISCSVYGVRLRVEATDSLVGYLPSPFLPGARVDDSEPPEIVLTLQEVRSATGRCFYAVGEIGGDMHLESSVESAVWAVEANAQKFVAAASRQFVFVHAGVVGWRGKAILLPGRSFIGKSTLVMSLIAAGATYYSDEYAVIDAAGRVHPFNRLPRLRSDFQHDVFAQSSPGAIETSDALDPLPVGLVLKTCWNPVGEWQPQPLTPGEMLLTLIENTVGVRSQPQFSVSALKCAVAGADGAQSGRREASETAVCILQYAEMRNLERAK
jgi:hypothetical protein